MIRVSTVQESDHLVKMKVEGEIVSDYVNCLSEECERLLESTERVELDFSEVMFVDANGVEMLRNLESERIAIVNASPLVEELLHLSKRK